MCPHTKFIDFFACLLKILDQIKGISRKWTGDTISKTCDVSGDHLYNCSFLKLLFDLITL